ncbi:HAMP domain-containing protein [Clostridiaceae bacterium UIB06]|uniref:histidine kinase n=1 Tax=Clostridium thailandense TaxID=2794346 RepID=A0A949TXF9_9CLOT|nr:HAMP domain-containing sensor histidine kinase [Clostridium thailandense]MBV7273646.1 HAMP domain-containing protein [Clostridium thailandense]MCH5137038.1 HAMP domain-containing protein [Clostridiaceae bacterium UIB06]
MRYSIRYKFAIGLFFIFCVSFNVMTFVMNKIVVENNKKIISDELLNSQRDLNIYFRQFLLINKIEFNEKDFEKQAEKIAGGIAEKINNRVILYKNDGNLLFDTDYSDGYIYSSENEPLKDNHEDLKLSTRDKSSYKIVKLDKRYVVIFSQPLYTDNKVFGILRYVKDYTELFEAGNSLLMKLKVFMFSVFLMIFVFAILLATQITIPIIKLGKLTKEISSGNFDINLKVKSRDEVGQLGKSFSKMKDKIKEQIWTIEKDRDDLIKLEGHKKAFFDNVTHEMKTPLTIISGYSQMILDEVSEDEEILIKAASKIKRESEHLHSMVTDLLDMSKIETRVDIDFSEKLDMKEVIEAVCDDMIVKAKRYEISIEKNLQDNIIIFASKDEIRRMLINVIDNSIKYGKVKSLIRLTAYRENSNCILIVEDQGKGIAEENLNRIFEPFYRVDKAYSKERGGSGLGLAIVKSILDKYKGKINIQSKVNEGTKVCIKIPLFLQLGNNLDN